MARASVKPRMPSMPPATLEALQIATDRWVASDGQLDLIALLDGATSLLTPASRRRPAK
jgi:hypothetical protein